MGLQTYHRTALGRTHADSCSARDQPKQHYTESQTYRSEWKVGNRRGAPRPGKVARAGTRARHASWRSGTSRIGARCAEVRSRPPTERTEGHGLEIVKE